MLNNSKFTVLDSFLTVSGEQVIILNTYDADISINAIVSNTEGLKWLIKTIEKKVPQSVYGKSKRNYIASGAVIYLVEPVNHNKSLKTGDCVIIDQSSVLH